MLGALTNAGEARSQLYRTATRAVLLGLCLNLTLGLVKLGGGIAGRSFALIADAVNSLGDVVTAAVVLFAFRVAQQPPDREHPYGHTRAEAVAGSNVALLIIVSAIVVAWKTLQSFAFEPVRPDAWTLWIAGSNVVLKEWLYRYNLGIGRRTGSSALIANAWDHRADALTALTVLIGLSAARLGGPEWVAADRIAALLVAAVIMWAGASLFYRSAHELMDRQAGESLTRRVRAAAGSTPGVSGVDKLWIRKTGLEYLVDIHIEVEADLSVAEGHRIGHRVKDDLLRQFPNLRDVLVHLEPSRSPSQQSQRDASGQ